MPEPITERVAQGAALLDEKLPGWHERIDVGRLDLGDTCDCILGQEFASHPDVDVDNDWSGTSPFDIGVRELFAAPWYASAGQAEAHGFDAIGKLGRMAEVDALTAEWRRVILARRSEAGEDQ